MNVQLLPNKKKYTRRHRAAVQLLLVGILTVLAATPAQALTVFGRVHVIVEGFQGYRADIKEELHPFLESVETTTLADGFFRLETMAIMLLGDGPIRWPESDRNHIDFTVGRYKLKIPTDWIGWKVSDRVFLQGINCVVDAEGSAYCTQDSEKKEDLLSRYALRFGISGMRQRVVPPVVKPDQPEIIRPDSNIIRPAAPIRPEPSRPAEPEIIGPAD